jgi:HK97 gp10 family phage protein
MPVSATIIINFNHIPGVNPKLRAAAAKGLNTGIMAAIGYADPLTPVDTGALKGNKSIVNASVGSLVAQVTWNQHYAIYQEFGTSRGVSAKQFATRGGQQAQPALVAAMSAVGNLA